MSLKGRCRFLNSFNTPGSYCICLINAQHMAMLTDRQIDRQTDTPSPAPGREVAQSASTVYNELKEVLST